MSLPLIQYPYLPEGREYLYVEEDNPFMQAAKEAAEQHGCRKHATSAVVVKDGKILYSGSNAGTFVSVCPRAYKGYPTGEGYHFCKNYCHQEGHSEVIICKQAEKDGVDLTGTDLYLYGHWWICQNCWDHILKAGIKNTYLMKGSEKLFNYDFQKEDKLRNPPPLKLYVSGPLTHLKNPDIKPFYEKIGQLAESLGYSAHVPHLYTDPVKNADVSPEEVYKIDSDKLADADLMICYVGEPSLGVGMEIEMGNRHKTLAILVYEEDQKVARLATGSPNIIEQITFADLEDALEKIKQALQKFQETALQQNVSVKI
jgi:deoxycytidylate deaminase